MFAPSEIGFGRKTKETVDTKRMKRKSVATIVWTKENRCPCCEKGMMVGIYSWEATFKKMKNKSPPLIYNSVFTNL